MTKYTTFYVISFVFFLNCRKGRSGRDRIDYYQENTIRGLLKCGGYPGGNTLSCHGRGRIEYFEDGDGSVRCQDSFLIC